MAKRRKKKRFRWIKFLFEIMILVILSAVLFLGYKFAQVGRITLQDSEIVKNSNISQAELSVMGQYTTIALFGVDSRSGELSSGTNSDTIMVCSINKKTGQIRIASVYRDTYLDTTGGEYRKCTEVYSIGGAAQAISMLNKNLDLNISDYVTVNFRSLVDIVDLLGGIDITLSEGEVQWLNGYLVEEREVLEKECPDVPGPGLQHLNGMQALAYSRIRYIGMDYERTERQRTVLGQVLQKAQNSDPMLINSAIDAVLPNVETSLSLAEILQMMLGIGKYSMEETVGFPFEKTTMEIQNAGDCVIPINLAENVSLLHNYLYRTENYIPSEEVQEISNTISYVTGIY